jgi:hypothetical protein
VSAKNADEGVLGERAGGPPFQGGALFKKLEGSSPVRVIGVPERNQHINIEKVDHEFPVEMEMILASSSSY